ncbi:MAG: NAD(P)/FAD-dependent oxidoreductase [Chloroflexi bacterium]|nr:NAD(P)/FAD-dependent oxidoreductase [Chloroflexota bacterium]
MHSSELNIAIIGAGVIGLAVAAEMAQKHRGVYVFERNRTFGLETSSRNSEVIHAGIYNPPGSLKAKLCVEGRELLYELCARHGISHRKLGKIIVAVDEDEFGKLERLCEQGRENGVDDLRFLSRKELRQLEPEVEGIGGLLSPSTGILDVHALMSFFHSQAKRSGAEFVFNAEVIGLEKTGTKYRLGVRDREGIQSVLARIVINCASLNSDQIAQLAGIDTSEAGYRLHYCKGEYFSLSPPQRDLVSRLVYPVPEESGLGIHITRDIEGKLRLGPNAYYIDNIDYKVDDTHKEAFYQAVKRFLPAIEREWLAPDFAGIRSKLQGPGDGFRDFVIAHEDKRGLPGLINLIGIESPGLTASPAVARYVAGMIE